MPRLHKITPVRYWSIHADYCTDPARVAGWARQAVDCRDHARRARERCNMTSSRVYASCARFYEQQLREAAAYLLARGAGPMRSF